MRTHRIIRAVVASVAALSMTTLAACSNSSSDNSSTPSASSTSAAVDLGVATPGTLNIGTITDAKPYAYSENGELKGFEIDLIKAAADKLNLKPQFTTMDFSGLLAAVNNSQFDVGASAIGITADRKKLVDFSHGYLAGYFSLLTKNKKVTSLDDVKGKKVGVLQGSIQDANSATLIPGAVVVRFPDTNAAKQALKTDRVDGLFIDFETALAETKVDSTLSIPFNVSAKGFPAGWAVKKGNQKLLDALNKALDEVIADGTWLKLYKQYFPEDPVPTGSDLPPYIV
ncbi:MAG: ABC transporter substrate-binding protein [Candidatus Nanopelagicales bacterium]